MELLLLLMLLPPLAGAALNGIFGRKFPQTVVSLVACGASGLAMVFALLAAWTFSHFSPEPAAFIHSYFTWIESGSFRADFALYYDRLTLVMTVTVTVVAFLIHLYSRGYMEHEGGYYRFFAYLNLFLFMMLLLVTASSYPLMFVGWEGVGLCSYLLIGFYFRKKSAADAGKKAFVVTRIGDVGFTLGVALLFWTFGTVDFDAVFKRVASLPFGEAQGILTAVGVLLFLGACGKSAQLPLYIWLPDAMEGPTPVSALIHAATMVTAGVYMVARSSILYAHAPQALEIVGTVGCLTAFYAATIALTQNDLKRMLAYSTISQLGYMFVGCGVGVFAAGIFHLMTHAYFKSLLFLGAGSVMHAMSGELDMRKMGGLRHKMKTTFWTFLIATLAISGVPMLSGFFSKDEILAGAYEGPLGKPWLYWLATVTAGLTAFYMFRAVFMTFCGSSRVDPETAHHVHESNTKMTRPLVVLAFFSVVIGYVSWPQALGGSEAFDRYLEPVFGQAQDALRVAALHHAESLSGLALMGLSLLAAGIGILVAAWFYLKSTEIPERLAVRLNGVYRVLVRKYYVDEFLDWLIVNPIRSGSEKVLWKGMDAGVIDSGLVEGAAEAASGIGGVLRRIQSGNIRSYAAWVVLGAVVWLIYALWQR
ncbi:MAG TPA: NADH-quinone oxidoreductase subunit L [Candidatus Sulfotelmatobacter sp.]|nr:NADH-quinone oxidoreductase subunit L [Candidatus Sulfotelmatobacter sp.]